MMKILVAFYSHSGITKKVAQQIQVAVGGDLFEIKEVNPYPRDYNAVVKQAKEEISKDFKPEIEGNVPNMNDYELVIIGSPNWWSTIAPPVATFLNQGNFKEKTIAPFITHGGGGLNRTTEDIRKHCPNGTVLEGFDANRSEKLSSWLESLHIENDTK